MPKCSVSKLTNSILYTWCFCEESKHTSTIYKVLCWRRCYVFRSVIISITKLGASTSMAPNYNSAPAPQFDTLSNMAPNYDSVPQLVTSTCMSPNYDLCSTAWHFNMMSTNYDLCSTAWHLNNYIISVSGVSWLWSYGSLIDIYQYDRSVVFYGYSYFNH